MASPTVSLNSWNQRSLEGKFEYQADFARQVAHLPLYDMSLSGVWASPLTLALPPPTLSRLVLHGSDYLEGTSLIEAASRLPPSSITSLDVRTLIGDWESANQLQRFKAICRSKGVDYLNVE